MSALKQLSAYYGEDRDLRLGWDIDTYAELGVVVLSRTLCFLARPVCGCWSAREIIEGHAMELEWLARPDPERVLTLNPDTWHVHIATGRVGQIWRHVPHPLPWVTLQRRGGRLRCYEFSQLQRHARLMGFKTDTPKPPPPNQQAVQSEPSTVRNLMTAQRRRRYGTGNTKLQQAGRGLTGTKLTLSGTQ